MTANDNTFCMFLLTPPVPVASVESVMLHINQLAAEMRKDADRRMFGCVVSDDYNPQQQIALLTMRFNDPLAQAVLLKLKHSTVVGMDFAGLIEMGLATREHGARFHRFTPKGRWVSAELTKILAAEFNIIVPHAPRVYSKAERSRYERGRLNWVNR